MLNVIYEDNHLLIIEKPENVLSQKDNTNDIDITEMAKEYLAKKYDKTGNVYLGLVHRLDRRVGGVMILAKTSKAASRLSKSIMNHEFTKIYLVKVRGHLDANGEINLNIYKDTKRKLAVVSKDGKESELTYHTIAYEENASFALVDLYTGRYNQIRVSFAHINHPVCGDYKYGDKEALKGDRLGLWCYKIVIAHPVTKEEKIFIAKPVGRLWDGVKNKL